MKAVNLHLLTRIHDSEAISWLLQAMSGQTAEKKISPHEAATLWTLTDELTEFFLSEKETKPDKWLTSMDGFYISYIIRHIGKEFDLLKISADGNDILNIELKSEDIGEERIKKQLEQNRYYLAHIAHTIYSFTYVMETGALYSLNERGYLKLCHVKELAAVLKKEAFQNYLTDGIDRFFRASDYLISPVASPEKYLQGKYFLTNQQFDFRKKILDHLQENEHPVVSVSGITGTGKTLLLFDLAMILSRKQRVLIIHSGPLRKGHKIIDERLKNVEIYSGEFKLPDCYINDFSYLLIDEAELLSDEILEELLEKSAAYRIPVIMTLDPRHLLTEYYPDTESHEEMTKRIYGASTLSLTFTGHIRVNRPVYSFLRTLLSIKDRAGIQDYSCIDVLYAGNTKELEFIISYYENQGYELLNAGKGRRKEKQLIAQEYNKVLMILDGHYYYDKTGILQVRDRFENSLSLLYEGLSRTRENLCLIVLGDRQLFSQILSIKLQRSDLILWERQETDSIGTV